MQEYTTPAVLEMADGASLIDAVGLHAQTGPDDIVFTCRQGERWVPVTAKEFATEVAALAAGLVASGVLAGDRVALMSRTRYEWTLCDYAIWTAGAVTVPIYETSSAEQVQWNLGDSAAVAIILETGAHRLLYDSVASQVPAVRLVIQLDDGGLPDLVAAGREVAAQELAERRAQLGPQSLATIIYTSGTTGRPKGCELTHANLLSTGRSAGIVLPEMFRAGGATLLFLPLAHVFARLIQVACVETGVRMGHTADIASLVADFGTFQPSFILAVPRVFEKIYNSSKRQAHAGGKGRIFDLAERTAVAYSMGLQNGHVGPGLRASHAVLDHLVYAKLRAALGGRVAWAVSGGAPLGARLGHFFHGIGLTICEGYGLTETTAMGTVNTPAHLRIGSVGRPTPGVSIRIADDGEILMKGDNVFYGYWNNSRATAEAVSGGWFLTGDLGHIDADGFVTITGRKKEIIVTAGGKNVAPAVLEDRLRAHPLVSQCLVVGDQRPFIACLVTLDAEAVAGWLLARGRPADTPVAQLSTDPDVHVEVQKGVDEANRAVSTAEAIRSFAILPVDWTEHDGQVTPSLKVKRAVVLQEFAVDIDRLYSATR